MTEELKEKLIFLAEKYETSDFLKDDPAKFMHEYKNIVDKEIAAFIAANLAFGKREQILSHAQKIFDATHSSPFDWIQNQKYKDFFENNEKSFYRIFTNRDFLLFFDTLFEILQKSSSLGEFFEQEWKKNLSSKDKKEHLFQVIASVFPKECGLIAHTKETAAKRLNMLLRWLVRKNSAVDLGLWTWFDAKNLLIPLDTHVLRVATDLELLQKTKGGKQRSANLKTTIFLTNELKSIFPDDQVKADFALFGSGVYNQKL